MTIKVDETAPGCITLTCRESGRPLTRSNYYGMFCDAAVCTCEIKSKEMVERLGIGGKPEDGIAAMFENMFGSEGFR